MPHINLKDRNAMLYYDTFKKIQKNEHFCINFVIPLKSANMTFIQKVLGINKDTIQTQMKDTTN